MWQRFVDWLSRRRFTLINLEIRNCGNGVVRIQLLDESGDPASPILTELVQPDGVFTLGPLFVEFDRATEVEVVEA